MQSASTPAVRGDIQALRAIAVIAVLVCHMDPGWLPGGYLGVDIFFVISGFVITQLLLRQQGELRLGRFWLQRFFRIVPAYAVMLAVVAGAAAIVFIPENFYPFIKSWQKSLLFLSNQYFAGYGDYFSPLLTEQPLLHTWSLAIEMQFYLLYPLLLAIVIRLRTPWLLLLATVAGYGYAQFSWAQAASAAPLYYALLTRAPEFLVGCTLAAYAGRIDSWLPDRFRPLIASAGFALMAFALVMFDEQRFSPVTASVACLGAALVMLARVDNGIFGRLYALPAILLLGAMSYSIYLWHWPVLALVRYAHGAIEWSAPSVLAYGAVVFALAWISWTFIEKRLVFRPAQPSGSTLRKLALTVTVAVAPAAYARPINGLVPELPIEQTRYADDKLICHGKILASCVRGTQRAPQVLVIGDSHAAQLNLAADAAGKMLDIGFEVITASSCMPLPGFNARKLTGTSRDACEAQIRVVQEKIKGARRIVIAGMWSYQLQDRETAEALNSFFREAAGNHQEVWVLGQIPKLKRNPRRTSRLQQLGIHLDTEPGTDWNLANQKLAQMIRPHKGTHYFDPGQYALLGSPPYFKDTLIYRDDHHLNEVGAKLYGDLLTALVKPSSM